MSEIMLPRWVERLLGEESGAGEGTVWTPENSWAWPPWVTLLFVVFAVAFVVTIYLRENRRASVWYRLTLAGIRLALVAVVLLMIAQLALSPQRTGLPYIAVLVDDSQSMTIPDRYGEELCDAIAERIGPTGSDAAAVDLTRWNLARTLLTEEDGKLLTALAGNYKLRVYFVGGGRASPKPGNSQEPDGPDGVGALVEKIRERPADGPNSRLGTAVRTILDELRGTAPAAIVLLTDGINTDGPTLAEAATLARRKRVPLFFIGLGSDEPVKDLKVADLLVDELVFVDDVVNFEFRMTATGLQGKRVTAVLREKGKTAVLARSQLEVGGDGQSQQVRLLYRPTQEGKFRYVAEIDPQSGEVDVENNRVESGPVEVRKTKIRVLLAQGYPNYEFRFLETMLQRDETIDLNTVLQDADPEHAEQDAAALRVFPVNRDELFSYDVIILGDVDPALISDSVMRSLVEFVDQPGKGGSLILVAGPRQYMPWAFRDTPLARLMPIELSSIRYPDPEVPITEGFQMRPTQLGLGRGAMQLGDTPEQTRTIWQDLPPLYWLMEAPDLKPGARVLAEHPTRRGHDGRPLPVICMQYVGSGKVVLHATDETWRWRRRVGKVFFARYWIQMIRHLSRAKLSGDQSVKLSVDRPNREYKLGESVRLRVQFTDPRLAPAEDGGVTVVLQREGHRTQRIELRRRSSQGTFEALLSKPAEGDYHARLALPAVEGKIPTEDFLVEAPQSEFEQLQMDAAAMRRAAAQTDGRYYTFQTAGDLLDELPPGHQVPIESLPRKPLWNKWPVLLLFLVLLVSEWILRKAGGMV
ncbi:MAG: VWA domain-containing protein [Candidatus Nealsonbacteria bacterium]|nr:VWA domain-containing protein [Candidatus Nealsonbacteria bacterium]